MKGDVPRAADTRELRICLGSNTHSRRQGCAPRRSRGCSRKSGCSLRLTARLWMVPAQDAHSYPKCRAEGSLQLGGQPWAPVCNNVAGKPMKPSFHSRAVSMHPFIHPTTIQLLLTYLIPLCSRRREETQQTDHPSDN